MGGLACAILAAVCFVLCSRSNLEVLAGNTGSRSRAIAGENRLYASQESYKNTFQDFENFVEGVRLTSDKSYYNRCVEVICKTSKSTAALAEKTIEAVQTLESEYEGDNEKKKHFDEAIKKLGECLFALNKRKHPDMYETFIEYHHIWSAIEILSREVWNHENQSNRLVNICNKFLGVMNEVIDKLRAACTDTGASSSSSHQE